MFLKNKTEFLFAHWAVRPLRDLRSARWRALVDKIAPLNENDPDALAFALTMARVNSCVNCTAQRYRERGGCASCSQFVLKVLLSKESEVSLLARFHAAQKEIAKLLETQTLEKAA